MGKTSTCAHRMCILGILQVPSASGLIALMMPSHLPVFLMPNGITTVNSSPWEAPRERKTTVVMLEVIGLERWKGIREWVQWWVQKR